jgi:hypothetical protein
VKRILVLVGLVVGCSKTAEPTASTATTTGTTASGATATAIATPPTPSGAAATAAAPAGVRDIAWDVPATWKSQPASGMRKATYKVAKAGADPEDAEMSVTQVGGGVDANVERWASQFPDGKASLKRTEKKLGPLSVTVVELRGKFTGGGMPGMAPAEPKAGYALLGAIVEGPDPPYFFKLTGPEKTVDGARADFDKLVASMRSK